MSEYQYHEWQTVDRSLTYEEQAAVNDLSSHIDVSSSRALVTYNWSSFRHDPKKVLLNYFDGYFYMANWGSLRLMFRFPKGLLDETDIEPYCVDEIITFETIGQYQVLDLDYNPEDGGEGWMEAEGGLSNFIHLRTELLEGDYRLLYLAWLRAMTLYDIPDEYEYEEDDPDILFDDHEPPVPPGLKKLSASLQNFVDVFDIDPFLVQAAAENSPNMKKPLAVDYRDLIARLERSECDDFLTRLAEGDSGVGLALRKRLGTVLPKDRPQTSQQQTIGQLLERAEQLEKAEAKRRQEAAHKKYIDEMVALGARQKQAWQQVEELLDSGRRIASVYDEATTMLKKLHQLVEFQDTRDVFQVRIQHLADKYASRHALIERWKKRGWV